MHQIIDEHIITGNSKVVRNINRSMILNIIRTQEPISRVNIAKLTGLNKSTVSSIVGNLLQEELIYEHAAVDQNAVGRNPIDLYLKLGKYYIGAINMAPPKTHLAVVDINGAVLDTSFIPTDSANPKKYIKQCLDELEKLYKTHNVDHLEGVGISVAGIVHPKSLEVRYSPYLGWSEVNLGTIVKEFWPKIKLLAADSDAKCSAIAEMWFGTHNISYSSFVFVSVGVGIGTGIVVNNRLIDGESHASGEFGHIALSDDGPKCKCGNNGCWETFASDRASVKRYMEKRRSSIGDMPAIMVDDLIEYAMQGDQVAYETLLETGYYLGLGITNIIRAIDPKTIIIGGRIVQAWDIIYPEIIKVVEKRAFFGGKGTITILPTSLKIRPRVLGAATLAIKEIFDDYKIML